MTGLLINVTGAPGAQGSKRGFVNPKTGRVVLVEQNEAKVKPWRQDVKAAAIDAVRRAGFRRIDDGPVTVAVTFRFQRPAGHYGTGGNRHKVKDSAPSAPCTRTNGDVEKLVRSTHDALSGVVFRDDSQVADLAAVKAWCGPDEYPGATIYVAPLIDDSARHIETAVVQEALI